MKHAKSQVLLPGASNSDVPALPYPAGPMYIPSPAQPSHFERTNAVVSNH